MLGFGVVFKKALGVCLMKWFFWIFCLSFAWWPGNLVAEVPCRGRALAAEDGTASGVEDCELNLWTARAALRKHLAPCVQAMQRADLRVFGALRFDLFLAPGGGLLSVHQTRSTFDKTDLPNCAIRVIRRRMNRPRAGGEGKPVVVSLRLRVDEDDFSLEWTASVVAEQKKVEVLDQNPLPGGFRKSLTGPVTTCAMGAGSLVLRLESLERGQPGWHPAMNDTNPMQVLDSCLAPVLGEGQSRRKQRTHRRKESKCLSKLLTHPDPRVRVLAADAIHDAWHWRARRALDRAGREMVVEGACRVGDKDCTTHAPAGYWPGMALVRILRAQVRLQRRIRDEVLTAVLKHDMASVRLRFVRDVMRVWKGGVPDLLAPLYRDPDPLVRVHACQRACLEGNWQARHGFVELLDAKEPGLRAIALLHAQACARQESGELRLRLSTETEAGLAALMRLLVTDQDPELTRQAADGLLHDCPLVRYLSARWLARLPEPPADAIEEALAREQDPLLREGLLRLQSGQREPRHREQIWWQTSAR
ncbi:MAG: hypothetical protein JRF33_22270 [Deltaproteobacteria bacterium]|nr:hypothetical protein [Deltaproteobacteria bacterium]